MHRLVLALALVTSPIGGVAIAKELCGPSFETVSALRQQLLAQPGIEPLQTPSPFSAYADGKRQTVWTFTETGHPAHPAVVCRQPYQEGASIKLRMQVTCGASKPACDALVSSFQALPPAR